MTEIITLHFSLVDGYYKPLQYIYLDEAGISAPEPATVVVGIIVDADKHWRLAAQKVEDLLLQVPEEFREGFVFHAKEIWGSKKYKENWPFSARLPLMIEMMQLPRKLNIPITLGLVRRETEMPEVFKGIKFKKEQYHHISAFHLCLARADKYIRDYCQPNEVATVIAENIPEMQRFLRPMLKLLRESPMVISYDGLAPTKEELQTGQILQDGTLSSTCIVDDVNFVEKREAPLLQLADACAYGFRRYFSKQPYGTLFVQAILNHNLVEEDWSDCASAGTFFGHEKHK